MAVKNKREEVSVSFHYLTRQKPPEEGGQAELIPFTQNEFNQIFEHFKELRDSDIEEQHAKERIKFRQSVVIEEVEKFDTRYISGIYKTSYWGHSFENSDYGKISAESINLRRFFFLLYFCESGKIYIASQYLGNFGSYTALKNSIVFSFNDHAGITASSFNVNHFSIKDAVPKAVEIRFSKKTESISANNSYGKTGAITFKKKNKDDGFETKVSKDLLSFLNKPEKEIRHAIADNLKQNLLLDMADDEIEGCDVIALFGKKRKTIHLLDESSWATRIPVDVPLDTDGHPEYKPLKEQVISILKDRIIAWKEDV